MASTTDRDTNALTRLVREDKLGLFVTSCTCLGAIVTLIGLLGLIPDSGGDPDDPYDSEADNSRRVVISLFLVTPILGIIIAITGLLISAYRPDMIMMLMVCTGVHGCSACAAAVCFGIIVLFLIGACDGNIFYSDGICTALTWAWVAFFGLLLVLFTSWCFCVWVGYRTSTAGSVGSATGGPSPAAVPVAQVVVSNKSAASGQELATAPAVAFSDRSDPPSYTQKDAGRPSAPSASSYRSSYGGSSYSQWCPGCQSSAGL